MVIVLAVVAVMNFAGCSERVDEALLAHRKSLLSETAPVEFTTVEAARDNIEKSATITFEGQADLKAMASDKPKALFLVREVQEDDDHGGAGHDPSTCPFCKRRLAAAPKAVVVFVDDKGKVIPYDVESLFSIKHGDTVVVEGSGKMDKELDVFQVTASSVFVRN